MDFATPLIIQLIVLGICGTICACIASSKGRSAVGWFFIGFLTGILGIIIALVVSNVKEDEARRTSIEQENRRLREQIRQEQIKSESFRSHAQRRLDVHDQTLGLDTRTNGNPLLEDSAPVAGLIEGTVAVTPPEAAGWYYAMAGQNFGPVTPTNMAEMLRRGAIPKNVPVWIEGMADWTPAAKVPALNAIVGS